LWTECEELPLWRPQADFTVPFYATEREGVVERQLQEYRRLLYVGLSRAQDRLYICGWQTRVAPRDLCWHALCGAGLAGIATPFGFDTTALLGGDGWLGEGLRLTGSQTAPHDRFKRGLLVHRLLQSLPDLPTEERDAAAAEFLARPANGLHAAEQDEIRHETLAVLRHSDFAAIFGPGSHAEVPLVGLVEGRVLSGQIDRLIVIEDRVLVVDFKTLRPPPATEAEVAPVYLRQLALYRAALARIYPGREIRCALLWTEGPRLMPISPERLAGHPA
jgi:ATP-dependent helicase/nuclease subunit A